MDCCSREPARPSARGAHKRVVLRFGAIILLASGFLAGVLTSDLTGLDRTGAADPLTDQPGFETLQHVWDLIHDQFVDPDQIDDQALLYGAARGMAGSLGDSGHSSFLDPDEADAFDASLSGALIGLGISMEYENGEPVIVAPIKNSPAEAAGLLPGDVIVEIDGMATLGMTDREVSQHLRGDAGTPVTLTIERADSTDLLLITVVRARIELDPVSWAWLPDGRVIVQLHAFSAHAGQELRDAFDDIASGGQPAGIVLDLRDNPGGLVSEAVEIAGLFMPEGSVLYLEEDRDGTQTPVKTIGNDGPALETPLVVLVNRASASAAEMLAASLRDNGRALLVGERTFGTGTVVSTFRLDDGAALALGTSFWKTPDGELVWKTGLTPDVEVRQADLNSIIDLPDGSRVDQSALDLADDILLDAALDQLQGAAGGET